MGAQKDTSTNDHLFRTFVASCVEVIDSVNDLEVCQKRIAALAEPFASAWRMPDDRYLEIQRDRQYASYLLYLHPDKSLCVVLDVFMPGQAAFIHNHRCWCVFVCLDGVEIESRFSTDASLAGEPTLVSRQECGAGRIRLASAAHDAFHQVECPVESTSPAISLHIYGDDIGSLTRETWKATERRFVTFQSLYSNDEAGLPVYLDTL